MTLLMRGNRSFTSDDANRSDSDTIGGIWRIDANSQPRIRSNKFEFKTMSGSPSRAGNWVSAPGPDTDNYEVEAQLASPTTNLATDNFTAIMMTVPDTYATGTMATYFVASTGGGCAFFTQSGVPPTSTGISTSQTGQTQRTTSPGNLSSAAVLLRIRRQMYSATQSLFTAFVNDIQVSQWDDSGGVVPSGPTNRRFGFIVEGNHPVFPSNDYRSPAIDWITARDLW